MAMLNMNVENVDTSVSYDPVPAGEYVVVVTDSEVKETKTGTGKYLELTLEIQEGEFSGRRIWDRLNLWNQNEKTAEIALRQLAQLAKACGRGVIGDSSELHGIPVVAIVKVREDAKFGASNEVKGYKPFQVTATTPARPSAAKPAQPTAPAQPQKPAAPWQTVPR